MPTSVCNDMQEAALQKDRASQPSDHGFSKKQKKQPTSNKHSTSECLKAESSLLSAATWVFTNICRFPPMRPKFPLCFPWEQQQQQHWDRDETTFQANKVSIKICENINVTHRPPSHTPEIKAVEVYKEPTTYNGQFKWDEISSQKKKSLTASTVFLTLVSSVVIVPHLFNCWHDNMNHKNKALTQIKSRKETKPGWLLAADHHLINNSTSSELGKTHNNSRPVNVILVATFCN